jgi:protein O-GlcNAc transferase
MTDQDRARELFFGGLACLEKRDFRNAETAFLETLKLAPRSVPTLNNLAIAQYEQGRVADAAATATRVLEIDPRSIDAYLMLSSCQKEQQRYDDVIKSCQALIAIEPTIAEAHCNLGYALNKVERYQGAIASFDRAIALNPQFADAYLNRGNALNSLKRFDEAFAAYDRALAFNPNLAEAWLGRGTALTQLKRYEEASVAYDKALALKPALPDVEGERLNSKMQVCDWTNFATEREHVVALVRDNKPSIGAFQFLCISSSPEDELKCARLWTSRNMPASGQSFWRGEIYKHDRIRVAYVSSDLRQHAIGYLVVGMFELHDKSLFEISAISIGSDDGSETRSRIERSVDTFVDAATLSDRDVALWIKEKEIDLLIDVNGLTGGSRTAIFAHRPAPIQVNYLGYPGTMGASYMDYLIGDEILVPQAERQYYDEKIACLPNCYQVNDRKRVVSESGPTRAAMNLPETEFVFCCFNNNFKILPDIFDSWMAILGQVEGSVLWLLEDNARAAENLRKEAAARGVDPKRIVFAKRMPLADHLARHRLADLFLDTLPYNAHTTASDALWTGLPVLTRTGETFAGRVATSLLNAIGLPELVTRRREDYERLAIELARQPDKLASIKEKLARNRLTTALFDTQLSTRHIESTYRAMYERYQAGLPPDHLRVLPRVRFDD